jgi:hypothetical protein
MADVLKYGWAQGGKVGHEMKCAKSQYFNRLGGAFVTASGATGVMKLTTASTDVIVGWAEVPRAGWSTSDATVNYFLSSSTVGKDKIHVITDPNAIFRMPVFENEASLTASLVGRFVAASAQGSGTTLIQKARAKATTTAANQQLFVVGVDMDDRTIYVRLNPHHVA